MWTAPCSLWTAVVQNADKLFFSINVKEHNAAVVFTDSINIVVPAEKLKMYLY